MTRQKTHSKVYILGPMRGYAHYNHAEFDKAEDLLEDCGKTVVSPARLDRESGLDVYNLPDTTDWSQLPGPETSTRDTAELCVMAILHECGQYVCLTGWESSRGARAEKALLDWVGADDVSYLLQPRKKGNSTRYDVLDLSPTGKELATYMQERGR